MLTLSLPMAGDRVTCRIGWGSNVVGAAVSDCAQRFDEVEDEDDGGGAGEEYDDGRTDGDERLSSNEGVGLHGSDDVGPGEDEHGDEDGGDGGPNGDGVDVAVEPDAL